MPPMPSDHYDDSRRRLDDLESRFTTLRADFDFILSSVRKDGVRLTGVESAYNNLDTRMADLEADLRQHRREVEQALRTQKESTDALDGGIGALLGEGANTQALTQRINEQVASMEQGFKARLDAHVEHTKTELQAAANAQVERVTREVTTVRGEMLAADKAQEEKIKRLSNWRRLVVILLMGLAPVAPDILAWLRGH